MRASRLISLLLLLQNRGQQTAAELAERLEVSVRTVYRDIEALSAAGVPVYGARGPGGGCRLLGEYRTQLTGLSPDEAEVLFLAGVPGPAAELGLASVLAAAQLKVIAALPERIRETAATARQRFHLDAPGWFRRTAEHPELERIAGAVWSDRRIEVTYRRGNGDVVERRLEPIGLVLKAGAWYLVARTDENERVYRVSRMLRVSVTDEHFERSESFELDRFWAAWSREFEAGVPKFLATVRVAPGALREVEALEAFARAEQPPLSDDPAGCTTLVLDFGRLDWAEAALLRLGARVEVLEPPELRQAMERTARALGALYGGAA